MDYKKISVNIQPRSPWVDVFIDELSELGCDSFEETENGFSAYITVELYGDQISSFFEESQKNQQIESLHYEVETIVTKNWNEVWESSFDPIIVGNWCTIKAPFHKLQSSTTHCVVIEPKMSFGTGHHETTYMMVENMQKLNLDGKKVLDMGSGTGVLAILAKKMKANAVTAIDIEEWAVENCSENATMNNVSFEIKLGGKEQISAKDYDVILANINRNILADQMSTYSESLKSNGKLLLSGFLSDDEAYITDIAQNNNFTFASKAQKENWLCLTFSKK